jgi:hypothetical protein
MQTHTHTLTLRHTHIHTRTRARLYVTTRVLRTYSCLSCPRTSTRLRPCVLPTQFVWDHVKAIVETGRAVQKPKL